MGSSCLLPTSTYDYPCQHGIWSEVLLPAGCSYGHSLSELQARFDPNVTVVPHMDAHMPLEMAEEGLTWTCLLVLSFEGKSPGGNFRYTQEKEHDRGRITSHTVSALGRVSKASLAFRVGFWVLPCTESNPSPHGFLSNHSLSRLYLPAKSKSSPSHYSSTWEILLCL